MKKEESYDLVEALRVTKAPRSEDDLDRMPQLYTRFVEDKIHSEQEQQARDTNEQQRTVSERDIKQLKRQSGSVLQSARQIFSIAINCLQQLHNIKDGNSMTENLGETIDNYKL